MSESQELGLFSGISNEDYHAGEGISSTSVKHFLKTPRTYQAYNTGEITFNASDVMDTGTVTHCMVLQPDEIDDQIIVHPELLKPTQKMREATKIKADIQERIEVWDEFEKHSAGKLVVSARQFDDARFMTDAVLADPECRRLLKNGIPEMSGYYKDPETGLLLKYRPDWKHPDYLADLKTCGNGSKYGFKKSIESFKYQLSASHYLEGENILEGNDHRTFIFLCVENKAPWLVSVYVLEDESLRHGDWLRRKALNGIKHCQETNIYPSYNGGIATTIGINQYLINEMED